MNMDKAQHVTLGKSEALFVTTPNGRITIYTGSFVNATDPEPSEIIQLSQLTGNIKVLSSVKDGEKCYRPKRKGVKA
jgi:hypothetical protein